MAKERKRTPSHLRVRSFNDTTILDSLANVNLELGRSLARQNRIGSLSYRLIGDISSLMVFPIEQQLLGGLEIDQS